MFKNSLGISSILWFFRGATLQWFINVCYACFIELEGEAFSLTLLGQVPVTIFQGLDNMKLLEFLQLSYTITFWLHGESWYIKSSILTSSPTVSGHGSPRGFTMVHKIRNIHVIYWRPINFFSIKRNSFKEFYLFNDRLIQGLMLKQGL